MEMDLSSVKQVRKDLNLTQKELARLSGVSQSLVAKIEAGVLDPSYSNAQKIFATLQGLLARQETSAKELMSRRLIGIGPRATVPEAIGLMRKHGISQLPVLDGPHLLGLVREKTLIDALLAKRPAHHLEEIMLSPPPIVAPDAPLGMVRDLLQYWPIVLVRDRKQFLGVIAKADLLSAMVRGITAKKKSI